MLTTHGKIAACCTVLLGLLFLSACCDEKKIPDELENLYSSEAHIRNQAALDLARCGSKASEAVPRLSELIYDQNVGVQSSAAYALRKIDTPEARRVLDQATAERERKSAD